MISLPNNCRVSEFSVYPANWDKMKEKEFKPDDTWYITYRFYDASGKVKQLHKRRMNSFKTLSSRREATKEAIIYLLDELKSGYNPITNTTVEPVNNEYEIHPNTPVIKALRQVLTKVKAEEKTKQDIKYVINAIEKASRGVKIDALAIGEVKRRHIKSMLDYCEKTHDRWSANQFNHYRKYLNILFSQLVEYEAIEHNPIKDIKKQKTVKKIKEVLTDEQRREINLYLMENYYTFWRYLHIFFGAGARTTELFRLQAKDVDLKNQRYKVIIKKGNDPVQVYKTIKDVSLPLWIEIMADCTPDMYLFGYRLKPSVKPIKAYQISKRWTRIVKAEFPEVKATFNCLRHLSITATVDVLNESDAANFAGHKSQAMVKNIYDIKQSDRQHERLKKIDNKFA